MSVLQATAAADHDKGSRSGGFSWVTIAGIILVSVVYFTDIFLKASHKCFWFDELFAVYLCRLPSFTSTWSAVMHGADFNPPLFYLLTRGSQRLFGEGLIATRLPAMSVSGFFASASFFCGTTRRDNRWVSSQDSFPFSL